jgi:hypothetical protein
MTRKGIRLRIKRYSFDGFVQIAPWLWPCWFNWWWWDHTRAKGHRKGA